MSERTYEGWIVVFNTGTDYEADLVRDRLDDADIPCRRAYPARPRL